MKELLKTLTETYGPSGHEDKVRELIRQEIAGHVDEISTDVLGNLIAVKHGNGPKLMISAHMDEIGLIVSDIDEKGFLRFLTVGGVPPAWQLVGQRVTFADGAVGVLGREKIDDVKDCKYAKMFIDIGARTREEAAAKVKLGAMAVFTRCCADLGARVTGKALDDRIGCALLVKLIQELPPQLAHELIFVFSVQEEVGTRGAGPAAFRVTPDAGLAVDVTLVGDTPEAARMAVSLGAGPAVKVMDNGLIAHPKVRDWMVAAAERAGLPYQLEVLHGGTTDARPMHLTGDGIPCGVLSIPCRYVHTPAEMVDWSDVENSLRLLKALVASPLA